ncbi:MAG: GNAT family N-acetyltransferase [Alphaproteobacteria bacterium]
MGWTIRALKASDLDAAHALRHDALRDAPTAFGSSPDDALESRASWADLLAGGRVFAGFDDTAILRGMAALGLNDRAKTRHRARMWGVYVAPAARGHGLAQALVAHVVAEARGRAEWLDAAVAADNAAAIRVYEAAGFTRYGTEPAGHKVDGTDIDLHLMTLRL